MKICTNETCRENYPDEMNFCSKCGSKLEQRKEPLQLMYYLYADRDTAYDKGINLGFEGKVLEEFSRICYEVGMLIEVDPQTGKTVCLGIEKDGSKEIIYLREPVTI